MINSVFISEKLILPEEKWAQGFSEPHCFQTSGEARLRVCAASVGGRVDPYLNTSPGQLTKPVLSYSAFWWQTPLLPRCQPFRMNVGKAGYQRVSTASKRDAIKASPRAFPGGLWKSHILFTVVSARPVCQVWGARASAHPRPVVRLVEVVRMFPNVWWRREVSGETLQ